MSEYLDKIKKLRETGKTRYSDKFASDLIDYADDLERQLEETRELTDKFIKRTESVLQALYEDGSEEGHSEFFYRMNAKEQCLNEGFLRKLKQLKEKGGEY